MSLYATVCPCGNMIVLYCEKGREGPSAGTIFLFYIAKRIKNKRSDKIHNFFKNFNLLNGLSRDYIGREKYIFENISSEILPK